MIQRKLKSEDQLLITQELLPPAKSSSLLAKFKDSFAQWLKRPDMTFEQWERLERKYSPHSSHHEQIYYRDRGL